MAEPDFFKTQKVKIELGKTDVKKGKKACLIIISGPDMGKVYFIDKPSVVIGREEDADIWINSPHVSRKHAQIISKEDKIALLDLKSTNGTFVNLDPVSDTEQKILMDGDKILFGNINTKFLCKDDIETAYHEELYQLASHDGTTDVYNKMYFLKALEENRHKKPLSLIMFDIDFFKKINDTFGHLAGDFILKEMVKLVKSTIRGEDMLARFGGEEFVILMEKELDTASRVAERIRVLVEEHKFIFAKSEINCTISLGVYCIKDFGAPIEQWLESVDKMLYQAKNSGRNKVCY